MGHEIRADYSQVLMFPPSVGDWVGPEHPARFIRDMVDSLDLEAMGFRVPGSGLGRARYAADLLLKVLLYGYFHRIRPTRRLEAACRANMGLIWLTGMKVPDLIAFHGRQQGSYCSAFQAIGAGSGKVQMCLHG